MTLPHEALGQKNGLNKEESAANTLAKKEPGTDLPTPLGGQEMLKTAWGPSEAFTDLGYNVHLLRARQESRFFRWLFFFQLIKTMSGDFHPALGGIMSLLFQPSAHTEMPGLETKLCS